MRPLYLVIQDINEELGIERVARALGISQGALYKAAEDPNVSGKPLAMERLTQLICLIDEDLSPKAQRLLDELLSHLVPQSRLVIHRDAVGRLTAEVAALATGGRAQYASQETLLVCKECSDPLQVIAVADGSLKYVCRGCRGAGA